MQAAPVREERFPKHVVGVFARRPRAAKRLTCDVRDYDIGRSQRKKEERPNTEVRSDETHPRWCAILIAALGSDDGLSGPC